MKRTAVTKVAVALLFFSGVHGIAQSLNAGQGVVSIRDFFTNPHFQTDGVDEFGRVAQSVPTLSRTEVAQALPTIVAILSSAANQTSAKTSAQASHFAALILYVISQRSDGPELLSTVSPDLGKLLESADLPIQRGTVLTLTAIGRAHPDLVVPALAKALRAPNSPETIGPSVLSAMLEVAPANKQVLGEASAFLQRPDQTESSTIASILVITHAPVTPGVFAVELTQLLDSKSENVKLRSIVALSKGSLTEHSPASDRLQRMSVDPAESQSVRQSAARALQGPLSPRSIVPQTAP